MVAYPPLVISRLRSSTGASSRAFGELVAKTRRLPDAEISQNRFTLARCDWPPRGDPDKRGKLDARSLFGIRRLPASLALSSVPIQPPRLD